MEEQIKEIFEYYRTQDLVSNQQVFVQMLREIQDVLGCIPIDIQKKIEEETGVKTSVTAHIIKTYPSLKQADYKHRIIMCSGARCKEKDNLKYMDMIKKELGISADGLSADKQVWFCTQDCLKQCRTSPNMIIDGRPIPNLSEEKIKQIVKELKK